MSISYGPGGMRRLSRRQFVQRAGAAGLGLAALGGLAACGDDDSEQRSVLGRCSASPAPPRPPSPAPRPRRVQRGCAGVERCRRRRGRLELSAAPTATGVPDELAYKGAIKIVGLGVDLTPDIKAAWEAKFPDVTLEFTVKSTPEISQIALTQPESQDLMSGYFHQMDQLWPSNQFIVLDSGEHRSVGRGQPAAQARRAGGGWQGGRRRRALPQDLPRGRRRHVRDRRDAASSRCRRATTTPTRSATTRRSSASRTPGRSCSTTRSRAASRSSTIPRSASWTPRWPSRRPAS